MSDRAFEALTRDQQLQKIYAALVGPVSAGNDSTTTAAVGATWTALASHAAKRVTINNSTGTAISVRYGTGTGISMANGASQTFRGITNSSDLQVKRTDDSNTQVAVIWNYEAF